VPDTGVDETRVQTCDPRFVNRISKILYVLYGNKTSFESYATFYFKRPFNFQFHVLPLTINTIKQCTVYSQ
jgi:hypothetical protein